MTDNRTLLTRCVGLCVVAALSLPVHAADLAPVQQGLWRVKSLMTIEPDPAPGAKGWPGLEGKPRARDYVICINEWRARQPMHYASSAVRADDMTLIERKSDANGTFETLYRRLDDKRFEGGWSGMRSATSMTFSYSAEFVSPDCGAVAPSSASKFGEP